VGGRWEKRRGEEEEKKRRSETGVGGQVRRSGEKDTGEKGEGGEGEEEGERWECRDIHS
jgi:hypothetical protein